MVSDSLWVASRMSAVGHAALVPCSSQILDSTVVLWVRRRLRDGSDGGDEYAEDDQRVSSFRMRAAAPEVTRGRKDSRDGLSRERHERAVA